MLPERGKIRRPEPDVEPLAPVRAEDVVEEVQQPTDALAYYTKRTVLKGGTPSGHVRTPKGRSTPVPPPPRGAPRPPGPSRTSR
jgi:hypothetical protein